jgi:hypothetical protein
MPVQMQRQAKRVSCTQQTGAITEDHQLCVPVLLGRTHHQFGANAGRLTRNQGKAWAH